MYGPNCQNNCSLNCAVSKQCDVITGEYIGGCQAGWKPSTCDASKTGKNLVGQYMLTDVAYMYLLGRTVITLSVRLFVCMSVLPI